jgi:HAE1 family hydrophobic/amphiphilic exporter-1
MQAEGTDRTTPADISQFYVRNNDGDMVPLSALQTTGPAAGPQYTNRFNVYRAVQVTGAAADGYSSGQALDALEDVARTTLPREFGFDWSDLSYQERVASGSTRGLFMLSILFVFLILAALYESWSLPFSVLLSVPVAVVGAFAGLLLRRLDFDVYAQIGVIMLIGLAAKNAILIVEFAKQLEDQGKPQRDATIEASRLRLRPILMTSFAFILGVVPLVLAKGAGAEMRYTLGVAVFSGMLGVTVFGIFFTPVFYYVIRWMTSRRAAPAPSVPPAEPPARAETPVEEELAVPAH